MAAFYSNENFPLAAVEFLRAMGHDVMTTKDAGLDNRAVPDDEVLSYATSLKRCVLTLNRKDFKLLHAEGVRHEGIVICKHDPDFAHLAEYVLRFASP